MDEAAHIDPNLFYKTIAPILQLKNTSLLALSSPEGNENYYSQLVNLEDGYGKPWFKVINKKFVCTECMKGDRAKQLSCDHVPKTEHWISEEKSDRLKTLYGHMEGVGLRELQGMVVSDYTPAFDARDIAAVFDNTRVITTHAPGIIYIALDPTQGGPSKLAITSCFFDQAQNCVVSVYSLQKQAGTATWSMRNSLALKTLKGVMEEFKMAFTSTTIRG